MTALPAIEATAEAGATGTATDTVGGRAPLSAWYALAVLIATTLFAFVDRQVINLIAPTLQRDFGLSDFQLGALQGLGFALFASAAAYPIGWLADRLGRRLVLAGCVLLWSGSTAAAAFQTSFAGLFAAQAGIAMGEAALTPIVFSMIPDLFPERQRNGANFLFFAAALLGAAVGFGLGGGMLEWLARHQPSLPGLLATIDGWRVALILAAAPGPLFMLLLTTIRMTTPAVRPRAGDAADGRLDQFLPFIRVHWRAFACLCGTMAGYGLALNSAFTWMPVAIPRIFGTASSAVGIQMGVAIAISTVIGLLLPALGTRLLGGDPAIRSLRLGQGLLLAAIPAALLMPAATAPWQVYASAGVQMALGLATAALMPGLIQQISPPALRSRLLAILGICTAVTQGLAPLLVGSLSALFDGPRGILAAIVAVALPGWAIGLLLIALARRPFVATAAAVAGD